MHAKVCYFYSPYPLTLKGYMKEIGLGNLNFPKAHGQQFHVTLNLTCPSTASGLIYFDLIFFPFLISEASFDLLELQAPIFVNLTFPGQKNIL